MPGQKLASSFTFDAFNPWSTTRYRLLRPADRALSEKAFNDPPRPVSMVRGEGVDTRWGLAGQQRLEAELLAPAWAMESPAVQWSEYRDWDEVAKLFLPYYVAAVPPELIGAIDRIAAEHSDPAQRAMEWLRFVQRELRYFSVALGEGGHIPRPPEEIWRTRFGDCKDAALLYVAGARRLELDVCPALVSTKIGPRLDQFLPSPTLFDHCVARVRIDGRTYWFDPTKRPQYGDLDVAVQTFGGWALPIAEGVSDLEQLNEPGPGHYLDIRETLELGPKRNSVAVYRRVAVHRFWGVDDLRDKLTLEGLDLYARTDLERLRAIWPGVEQIGDIEVDDDRAANSFRVSSQFQIRDVWRKIAKNRFRLAIKDEGFANALAVLKQDGPRRNPIFLGSPRKLTRRLTITMPRKWPGKNVSIVKGGDGLRYETTLAYNGKTITYAQEFVAERSVMPAEYIQSYQEVTAQLQQSQVFVLLARQLFGGICSVIPSRGLRALQALYWVFLLPIGLALVISSLEGPQTHNPGSGPRETVAELQQKAQAGDARAVFDLGMRYAQGNASPGTRPPQRIGWRWRSRPVPRRPPGSVTFMKQARARSKISRRRGDFTSTQLPATMHSPRSDWPF